MKTQCLGLWLLLWLSYSFAEQLVLQKHWGTADAFQTALSLLEPFKSEMKEFEHLDYGKLLGGEEEEHKPTIGLIVDYNKEYSERAYASSMNRLHEDQRKALEILIEASDMNDVNSTILLADINMFGNYSIPRNSTLSLKYYERLSRITGDDSKAHFMLGFIYATGLFGEVEQNQAKALMHYQAAHELGDIRSTMVLAYRYYQGISVEKNCELALFYYGIAAQKSLEIITNGPIGGPNIDSYSVRISDFNGGLYGSKSSEQSTSMIRAGSEHIYNRNVFSEINIDPENYHSIQSFYEANAYYNGDYFHKRDYNAAFEVAQKCAMDGDEILKWSTDVQVDKIFVAQCYYLLGHMYLRGEGTQQNYTEALHWLLKSTELHAKVPARVDLGLIYEYGLGLEAPNPAKARQYYKEADSSGNFHFARQLLAEGKLTQGFELMKRSAFGGSEQALYHLSTLYEKGIGGKKSCQDNVAAYKAFVERMEPVGSLLEWSFKQLFINHDSELALIGYAMAAEQGYESAQSSAGFLLYAPVPISESLPKMPKERFEAALTYYSRSSRQYNIDSTVFLGDLYYYGALSPEIGNDTASVYPDYQKAFYHYQEASNRHSKQGSFNVGYMYENGIGVPRDYHLAKRYYDLALAGKSDAFLPVNLALIKLRFKMFLAHLLGESGIEDDSGDVKSRTWNDWKDLYRKIKKTNTQYLLDEAQNEQLQSLSQDELVDTEEFYDIMESGMFDIIFLIVILSILALVMFLHSRNRRRREQGGADADQNNQRGNIQFNFMIIPL